MTRSHLSLLLTCGTFRPGRSTWPLRRKARVRCAPGRKRIAQCRCEHGLSKDAMRVLVTVNQNMPHCLILFKSPLPVGFLNFQISSVKIRSCFILGPFQSFWQVEALSSAANPRSFNWRHPGLTRGTAACKATRSIGCSPLRNKNHCFSSSRFLMTFYCLGCICTLFATDMQKLRKNESCQLNKSQDLLLMHIYNLKSGTDFPSSNGKQQFHAK